MLGFSKKHLRNFAAAILAVGVALIFTIQIEVLAGRSLLLFVSVMFATWLGGRGVGLFAFALATAAAAYFVLPPQYTFNLDDSSAIQLATFVALALPMNWLLATLVAREQLLIVSEARYRFLFENNPFPMMVFDADTLEFLEVNDAAMESYGYSTDEFEAMTIKCIRPPEDVPELLEHLADPRRQMAPLRTWKHLKKNGTVIDVETRSHEIIFEGRRARLVLANDVTDRLRAETQIRNSESRLRTIVENLSEGLAVADLDGNYLNFNRAAQEMHGFTDNDECAHQLGQFSELFAFTDMDGQTVQANDLPLARILRGEQLGDVEIWVERRDRPFKRIFRYGGTLIYDSTEKPIMAIVTTADITKRKIAEEHNRRLHETLESRVTLRTAELQAVNKELESFSYSVSHDLRAPLRHIAGYTEVLLDEYSNVLDENGRNFLREVRGSTQEMGKLIDDVLKLARVSQKELRREEVDLSELANEIIQRQLKDDPQRNIDITIEAGLSAYGDCRLLGVVLTNLLENAWKFTSKSSAPSITFCREPVIGSRGYCVRDNGSGFDMKYADRIFGAFQRLHSSDEFEGTGIGLATVQRIINRHGGQIWAEGSVGRGARFYFTLPEFSDSDYKSER